MDTKLDTGGDTSPNAAAEADLTTEAVLPPDAVLPDGTTSLVRPGTEEGSETDGDMVNRELSAAGDSLDYVLAEAQALLVQGQREEAIRIARKVEELVGDVARRIDEIFVNMVGRSELDKEDRRFIHSLCDREEDEVIYIDPRQATKLLVILSKPRLPKTAPEGITVKPLKLVNLSTGVVTRIVVEFVGDEVYQFYLPPPL